jgi:hypothetical protein
MENAMAIDVKQAVALASKYLRELVDGTQDVRLEEVEIIDSTSDSPEQWAITLSYEQVGDQPMAFREGTLGELYRLTGAGPQVEKPRYLRVFRIEADSGRVRSMKLRTSQ